MAHYSVVSRNGARFSFRILTEVSIIILNNLFFIRSVYSQPAQRILTHLDIFTRKGGESRSAFWATTGRFCSPKPGGWFGNRTSQLREDVGSRRRKGCW
ncbi:hypothetical protein BKA83DRAFT_4109804 [Pisolithus microcarpus]|nr:hypothetical protein BKA83DRAFT_4109804 [Pisolithus microcarpus]